MSKAYDYFREISANNNDMIMPNDTDITDDSGRIHDATGISEGLGGFLANLLMPGFSTALYRPSVQNFVGGLEGDAGRAANYLGAALKALDEQGRASSLSDDIQNADAGPLGSLGDWFINNGTYWNDRANDVQQQFGTLNRYQNEDILQRLTDTDYLTDSRGLMADVFNGAGSAVPFVVVSSLAPEIGIGGALARGAGGLLERLGMSTAGRAVASDLVQSGANDFARYALTGGPLEAAINAGGIYDDLKNQGLSDSEIFGKMNDMIGEELPMDMLTSGLYGAVLGGNTFSRLGQGGWKRAIAANVLNTPADMLGEYMQEMTQQQLQNKYSGKPYGTFWNPTEDEMQAGRAAAMGTLPMGLFGSARGVRNSRRAAMAAADGSSVTGPEPVTPPAVPDPNVDPVAAAQLTGKNDDVPTADGVDVTNLDPQQYTQWYGDKLKSQGIDVPDATLTVQTPQVKQAAGTSNNAKSGAPSYDASALEGNPQYTVSGEVSSTDVTPLADQKMRLLDSAYYNKYGQHLYITSMKRNGDGSSWHDSGQAFDTADDNLENNKEARDWLVSEGQKLGLTPLDEYENPSAHATGGHIHFSDHGDPIPEGATQNTQAQDTQETAGNGNAPAADLSSLPVGDIATAIAQNTGLPANFIWAQLSHESDGGNSKLAREDHNYGGVKGNDGEYLHFDNDQQFIDYMSNYYPKYREDGIYDAQTADQFAEALQHGGYFTADLGEYEGGMHRYLEQAGLSDSGTAGAPSEKRSGGDNANTMTQQQFGDMLNEKMIDFAGTNDDTVKVVFNDMSTSKDKALVSLFAPYMQDGAFANTAANREALVGNDGFKKAMSMFLSKHLSDYAPTFKNGRISFQQAEDALRPRHQVQAAQTAQAVQATQTPNIQTAASPKMEAAAIQNVLSSFVQGKKNAARTEQEANLFDDMLDADDHFIDTPKNRQTLLKNYGAQLQAYVDDAMTPSLNDRVNQAIEQAVQDKDLNRMNILTQAKQANDTAALEKLVGPQAQQHVDITTILTPANANVENRVSSKVQETTPSSRPATAERQAPQSEVASAVQSNTPVQQTATTENEMPQSKVASTVEANMPANQAPVRMDNQQAGQQDTPQKQDNVTPLPTQEAQQSEGVRIAQPQPTIDEQNAQMDARIAAIKKQPLAQRKALGQQYLDTLRQNNVSFSEKKLAKPLMDGEPEALEHVQRTYGDLLNTITPAEAAAASQQTTPRTVHAIRAARLNGMMNEIAKGSTFKNASTMQKLAYLMTANSHAGMLRDQGKLDTIHNTIDKVRADAGLPGSGLTDGMTKEQRDSLYYETIKQQLDDEAAIRKEATDEDSDSLRGIDNDIKLLMRELADSRQKVKAARKENTNESTQSESQRTQDEGAKNQDQHAKPEPRKAAGTQRKAEEGEVSDNKKAADEGGQAVVTKKEQKADIKNLDSAKVPAMGEPIHGIKGAETTVVTDSGKEIRVRYRAVPASRVITSHDAETMVPNKAYPQELQPRDRQRVSMQEQVTAMANELRPADLGAGRNLNQGAPIIRKDGVVLNGNGRAMAIQKATAAGGDKATAYRKYIFEHSKEFGLSRSSLAQLRKYMLVREVVDDIDADTMQDIIGSTAGGSRMGASEQAKADAKKIKPRDLDSYVDNEQGDLTTAANQDFVARVLYRIVGKNERNAYTDEHGNVNADGIQRVKRALFSLAYNDDGLINKMAESTDDNIRNVSRSLMSAAPAFARVNLAVKDRQAYEYDAAKTISDAVKHLDALRQEGKPVKDYLNEQSMFSEYQDTDEVREVLRFFDENKRSGKRIGIFLNDMAKSILEQGSPNQTSLMDGGRATLGEIIKSAERVARNGTTAASLFGNKEESHVDVARSKASVQGDLKKIGKRVVFLPDNSLTSREKGIKEFGEKMGLKVVFFEGPSNLHGMYENGVSFINRSSSTSAPWTFWHETFHWLRHNNPELYRQMVSAIGKKQAFSSEQLQAYRDKTGRQALSDADVIEEMLADAMPDVHKRVSLFRDLGKADASLLQRFVGWLRDAMRAFHDALTGRKAGLSEMQKAAMRDALANIAADLRDSNGKHIFKVNGTEREITATDGTKLSYPTRFSSKQEAPTIFTAEDRLKADSKAWKEELRKAWNGTSRGTMIPVMDTPLVLDLIGAKHLPMFLAGSKLQKIKHDHPELTKPILYKLPEYMADPMIIFKSDTVPGRIVMGLSLKDTAGVNVVVPIELNARNGRIEMNVLASIYGRGNRSHTDNDYKWFVDNVRDGNTLYINKKQAADFYQSAGLQLPLEGRRFNDLFGSSIKTDADLVKSRRENPVRYSLDANDNSTPSLLTRAYNHITGRKNAASHDKNVKAMLEDITKMRIRFGKLDPATEIVFKKFEGVIRARNANEWERVLPEAGRAIADRLQLQPSTAMDNYIAKWLLDEAGNDTGPEATAFKAALKNDSVLSDQLIDLKTLFNERNNREADEVVRSAIQYEKPKERTTLTKAWQNFYDEMIEELGPVKRMVEQVQKKSGQKLAASVNPYIALRLFRGNAGRAMTMIEGQSEAAVKALQTNYPGVNFEGFKTLHMILDECGALHNEERMKNFLAYALAAHVMDIHTLNNRIRQSQQRLREKLDATTDEEERAKIQAKIDRGEKSIMEVPRTEDGLSLTEERCDAVIKKYQHEYSHAQKDLVHFSKVTTAILYDAGVISKKRYKELQDRWPNYIPMFRVFEDNEDIDFGDSLKHMHGSTRRVINPLDSIIRNTYDFVKKAEKNKARQLLADLTRISDVGEYIEEVDNSKPNDKTTITFYENGERKYLQTDPDIVKAVNNMGREESNWVLRLLHAPAKIARACFTTINPSFALRNLIRDSTDASIYSKYGFKPWDFVRGFLHAVHRDELFYEWLSSGAAQASAISLDRDYTQATLNQMSKTWKERLLSKEFLPAILEGMQMVGEYSEYGTRIAAYERAKKKLAGENGPHPAAYDLASAALESRDLMDFARGGRGSRYLNNVVVFANASIQGFDKFFRTFDFRKPYRKESMKALARLFLCGMLPALLLAGIHSGDDWWEELPDWQKETNWILGKVGNTIIRIPKGQDIGLRFFSNLIEKAMDRSKHKAGDYFKPVWDSLPDMIPTALLPIIEATANHSYFTGAPVVPKYQEKLPAYLQFGNETSSFAKFVGKVIGVSPRKVEHVLFGYTGNMGKGLLGVYDTIVGNQSLNTNLNEAPVISGFTAIPYKQSKTVNDFYDKFDEQQRLNEEFKLTKKKPDGYDPALYKRMTKAQQELSKINKQERAAIDDPKMDSGIREQKQLGYQQQRLSVVRRVMGQ